MNSAQALSELVKIARAEIGVRETGGNNSGPRIREYQAATWLKPGPWPWCAAFVCWCLREWLQVAGVRPLLGIDGRSDAASWRPQTAGALDFERWGREKGLLVLPESATAKPGDIITFDFSHIGIVQEDRGAKILTIEGNTNGKGERDSESGDGVWEKVRERSLAHRFIRVLA